MTAERLTCPECGRLISLTRGGVRLHPHNRKAFPEIPERCPGSRRDVADLPTTTAAPTAETGA